MLGLGFRVWGLGFGLMKHLSSAADLEVNPWDHIGVKKVKGYLLLY